jgi:hypothetical protein
MGAAGLTVRALARIAPRCLFISGCNGTRREKA